MTCATLSPVDVEGVSHCFQAINPPITRIISHFCKNLVCFTHKIYDTKYDSILQQLFIDLVWLLDVNYGDLVLHGSRRNGLGANCWKG